MKDTCTIKRTVLTIPTYHRHPDRKLPELFASGYGANYPDTKDDMPGSKKKNVKYEAVILENRHLKLTIIPELGGKLWSAFDKNFGEESIYVPDVIKPCLVGRAGSWIPGGMEFNYPTGHHILTMRHMPVVITGNTPERVTAVVQRTCARTRMRMDVIISLAADEARFDIDYRVSNPTPLRHRWYQWTNVGVLASPQWQFQGKAPYYTTQRNVHKYPVDSSGLDSSWYVNRDWPSDSFLLGCREDWFGYYDHGRKAGICQVAPWEQVRGKKYFTWGYNKKIYNDGLAFSDEGHAYLEIQAGPFETQRVLKMMEPGGGREWNTTWIPYARTGGIDWADRGLIVKIDKDRLRLFAGVDQEVKVLVNTRKAARKLRAGKPALLALKVKKGDRIQIFRNGKLIKKFSHPYKGISEPNVLPRILKEHTVPRLENTETAAGLLKQARRGMTWDAISYAMHSYRKALKLKPGDNQARLELADALWHTGAFSEGAAELRKLLKTGKRRQAEEYLARRDQAEKEFFAPVAGLAPGKGRDLALAELYAGYGNSQAAFKLYEKLKTTDKDNWRLHYGLACYYYWVGRDNKKMKKHIEKALALKPGDRDVLIEVIPMLAYRGETTRARKLIETAPAAVRNINMVQKWLGGLYFETGETDKFLAIYGRKRIFNREGEVRHVDMYFDSCAIKCEQAIKAGKIRQARKWAEAIKSIPEGLGILKRKLGNARPALWDGIVTWAEGRKEDARLIWKAGAVECLAEIEDLSERSYAQMWPNFLVEELAWCLGMCARLSGDRDLIKAVDRKLKEHQDLLKNYWNWFVATGPFMQAVLAELKGDFKAAAAAYQKHLKQPGYNAPVVKRHLACVRKNTRRGENLLSP